MTKNPLKIMIHQSRKAPKDKIDSAADASMKENEELLKRLEHDELMITKKMKTSVGMVSGNDAVFAPFTSVPTNGLEDIATGSGAIPFTVTVYPHHNTTQSKGSEPIVIGG